MDLETLEISTAKIKQLNNKGIETVEDLTRFFPRKYLDFRNITPINQVINGQLTSIVGVVKEIRANPKVVCVKIQDSTNQFMNIIWFRQSFVAKKIKKDEKYIFCGKVNFNEEYKTLEMVNPISWGSDIQNLQKIMPIYSKIQGMSDEFLRNTIRTALALMDKKDYLEPIMLNKFKLPKTAVALKTMHQPMALEELSSAEKRFVFDDLFTFGIELANREQEGLKESPYKFLNCNSIKAFTEQLPFELTDGQKQAIRSIYVKTKNGERVNSLVQGDVGSGKTIVAIILMLIAVENGYQSALMAPTTVLAKQHYQDLLERTKGMNVNVGFLSGDMKVREKKAIFKAIELGEIDILVGTHSVISKDVHFKNLALSIVDEEHRFGVKQRNGLLQKAKEGVHQVSMSATPIPRTLALSLYGPNIDVQSINTLPKGRKPVKTILYGNEEKSYLSMYNQIKEGRQCYVVCPLIDDSEALTEVDSVEKTYKKMTTFFKDYPDVKIAMISGKMKQTEIAEEIAKFSRNEYQIIISTTIIEVGVNVPNSSVILIKNAERFGLAQLHQLRGRVGRGQYQSYCVLLSKEKDNLKLQAMCETTDGFKIAERDLQLRGTGDFLGTKQSGNNKYVMLMLSNPQLFEQIKTEIKYIFQDKQRYLKYKNLIENAD